MLKISERYELATTEYDALHITVGWFRQYPTTLE